VAAFKSSKSICIWRHIEKVFTIASLKRIRNYRIGPSPGALGYAIFLVCGKDKIVNVVETLIVDLRFRKNCKSLGLVRNLHSGEPWINCYLMEWTSRRLLQAELPQ